MINIEYDKIRLGDNEKLSIETIMKYAESIVAHGKYTLTCAKCNKEVQELTRVNNIMICDDCIQ